MRPPVRTLSLLLLVLAPSSAVGQSLEAVLGLAHRSPSAQNLPLDGFQTSLRAGYPVVPHLRMMVALGWTHYADQDRIVPVLCPAPPATCTGGAQRIPGLGMASLTAGLQPVLPIGGLELRPSALIGGYWLYHRGTGLPAGGVGTDAGMALGLPLGQQARILLEARWVHLFGSAGAAGSSRHFGIGIAFR